MAEVELDESIDSTAVEPDSVPQAVGTFFMSIAFWSTLVTAALMYAAVSLSPKLAAWIQVRERYAANAVRLQEMEDEADYLERVATALKNDPKFARRLVDATQSGNTQSELVPVSDNFTFGGGKAVVNSPKPLVQPAVAEVVIHLASHHQHRSWLLCCAAGLTVVAFTLFNDSGAGIMQPVWSFFRMAVARYRRSPPPETVVEPALSDD